MSGGSYDYVYGRISDAASELRARTHPVEPGGRVYNPEARAYYSPEVSAEILASVEAERLWLAGLLDLVATAMHDVEWVDSCDCGPGDEVAAIRRVRAYLGGAP